MDELDENQRRSQAMVDALRLHYERWSARRSDVTVEVDGDVDSDELDARVDDAE